MPSHDDGAAPLRRACAIADVPDRAVDGRVARAGYTRLCQAPLPAVARRGTPRRRHRIAQGHRGHPRKAPVGAPVCCTDPTISSADRARTGPAHAEEERAGPQPRPPPPLGAGRHSLTAVPRTHGRRQAPLSGTAPTPGIARLLARIVHGLAWRVRLAENAWALVEKELASTAAVPWRARPAYWRHGFLGEAAALYDFGRNDRRLYLSDYARFVKTRLINGPYGVLLDDKRLLGRLLHDHAHCLPVVFGTLAKGRLVPHGSDAGRSGPALADLLRQHGALVVKPVAGGGGRGVAVLCSGPDGFRVNGQPVGAEDLDRLAAGYDGHMVGELVRQHPALAALYPASTNTLRVVTMIDDEGAFIAAAVQRIG